MKVLCFGFGFVGKAYALYLREKGHNVKIITQWDNTSIEAENYGFQTPCLPEKFDVAIGCVPTPTINNKQDLSIVRVVLKRITEEFKINTIIIKSTILPNKINQLAKKFKKPNQRFILYPEFLEAKNPIGGVFNQTCKVFGKRGDWRGEDKQFVAKLFGFKVKDLTFTNLTTASMLKYVHNIWLSCNLSFWNSMMRVLKNKDIDFDLVLKETHKSNYFGRHPWSIGTAYGGACLPKDIKAFIS